MASIKNIIALKSVPSPEPIYSIWVSATGYDKNRHRVILRVNNSFYDIDSNSLHIDLRVFPKDDTPLPMFIPVNKTMRIYAQLYDFILDKVIDTKLQEFDFNSITQTYYASDKLLSCTISNLNGYWAKNKKVVKVEGPFDAEGKKTESIIKGERYYYKATPNTKLNEAELLSMKWSYQYDDGEIKNFENKTENINKSQNIMSCTFHKDKIYNKVKVYAYFVQLKQDVMANAEVSGGTNSTNSNKLVWSSKVSPEFCEKVIQIAERLELPAENNEGANWLMTIMALETARTFSPKIGTFIKNKDDNKGGYVGLVQFGKDVATDLGVKRSELMNMTALEQLDYVEKLFMQKKFIGKLKTKTDLYLAVNYPNACGHGTENNYVVYDSSKSAYDDNPIFKREKDEYWIDSKGVRRYYTGKNGKSYVWEFEEVMNEIYIEGKSNSSAETTVNSDSENKFEAKDILTYRIYNSGKIEKHVPKSIKANFKMKYEYIYIDEQNNEHELGIFNYFETKEMNPGNVEGKKEVQLLNAKQFKGYSKGDLKLKFLTWNSESNRWYINPDCFAGLLGAMANCNIDYLGFNGFSNNKAQSVGGSKSHRNGEKGDLRYLSTKKKGEAILLTSSNFDFEGQNTFNDALYLFGWGKTELMYSEYFKHDGKSKVLLNHTKHMKKDGKDGYRHNNHLHVTGFQHASIKTINE